MANPKSKQKAKPKPEPAGNEPFVTDDSKAAYDHFSSRVKDIPEDGLEHFYADVDIVRVNIAFGVKEITPHIDHLHKALPLLNINELLELPALTGALQLAAEKVVPAASKQEIKARQRKLRPLRRQTLMMLSLFAERGLVSADVVKQIQANSGPIDEAKDAINIASVFREKAAVFANKHPFTEEEIAALGADGDWLRIHLTPKGAPSAKSEVDPDVRVRDQLWTETVRRYDNLYKAGVEIWGRRRVDEHIRPLLSRVFAASSPPSPDGGEGGAGAPPT